MDEQIKAAIAKVKEVWAKNKLLFFIIIPVLVLLKFKDVIIDLLLKSSRKALEEGKAQDQGLKQEINQANSQANQIQEDIKNRDENKPAVDEDWNKK